MWLLLLNMGNLACLFMIVVLQCTYQSTVVDGRSDEHQSASNRTLQMSVVPQIISVQLVDVITACSVLNIDTTDDNVIINLATLTTTSLTLVTKTSSDVESVKFGLNSNENYSTESTAPYSMCGNDGLDLVACPWIAIGTYTLTMTPYSNEDAYGIAGTARRVTISIVNIPECKIPKVS
jgi:hypothetical protein